jgi:hypothetical protein
MMGASSLKRGASSLMNRGLISQEGASTLRRENLLS